MKAAVLESKDRLVVKEVKEPSVNDDNEALVRVRKASITRFDLMTINNPPKVPIIPGAEFAGELDGKRVAIYTRTFDGTCSMCKKGLEMFCKSGKRVGVDIDGGFAEYVKVPKSNIFYSDLPFEILSALSITALAPYNALRSTNVKKGDIVVVLGASGNSGIFAVQLGEILGAKVIAITDRDLKISKYTFPYAEAIERVKELTDGEMADVVINPLGSRYLDLSIKLVSKGGKVAVFGTLYGSEANINLAQLYLNQISIIGIVRGTPKQFKELLEICKKCNPYVWREYKLEEINEAFNALSSPERKGRILIDL